eukprot:COSAG01_NODE_70698_length_258_cov_0.553459_1_plen_47_part_10
MLSDTSDLLPPCCAGTRTHRSLYLIYALVLAIVAMVIQKFHKVTTAA